MLPCIRRCILPPAVPSCVLSFLRAPEPAPPSADGRPACRQRQPSEGTARLLSLLPPLFGRPLGSRYRRISQQAEIAGTLSRVPPTGSQSPFLSSPSFFFPIPAELLCPEAISMQMQRTSAHHSGSTPVPPASHTGMFLPKLLQALQAPAFCRPLPRAGCGKTYGRPLGTFQAGRTVSGARNKTAERPAPPPQKPLCPIPRQPKAPYGRTAEKPAKRRSRCARYTHWHKKQTQYRGLPDTGRMPPE